MPHTIAKATKPKKKLLKKVFKYISFLNPKPPLLGNFGLQCHLFNKFGRRPPGKLHIKFQPSEPSSSKEEDSVNIFLCFSIVQT